MKVRKIEALRFSGKWLELWFTDGNHDPNKFDECCKIGEFEDAIDAAGLHKHVYDNGRLGLYTSWQQVHGNMMLKGVHKSLTD